VRGTANGRAVKGTLAGAVSSAATLHGQGTTERRAVREDCTLLVILRAVAGSEGGSLYDRFFQILQLRAE
jgi:hypothetical protein